MYVRNPDKRCIRFGSTDTSCLQDTKGGFVHFQVTDLIAVVIEQDTVAQPVDNQGTHVGSRLDLQVLCFGFLIQLEEYQWVFSPWFISWCANARNSPKRL